MVTENDQPTGGGGINFTEVRSPLKPPGSADFDEEEDRPRGTGWGFPEEEKLPDGTVPLSANAIKLPLRAIGNMTAEVTQFPGWRFDEAELQAFADAMEELGLRLPKLANAIIVCGGIIAVKGMGYVVWVRAGRPSASGHQPQIAESMNGVVPDAEM